MHTHTHRWTAICWPHDLELWPFSCIITWLITIVSTIFSWSSHLKMENLPYSSVRAHFASELCEPISLSPLTVWFRNHIASCVFHMISVNQIWTFYNLLLLAYKPDAMLRWMRGHVDLVNLTFNFLAVQVVVPVLVGQHYHQVWRRLTTRSSLTVQLMLCLQALIIFDLFTILYNDSWTPTHYLEGSLYLSLTRT